MYCMYYTYYVSSALPCLCLSVLQDSQEVVQSDGEAGERFGGSSWRFRERGVWLLSLT